MTTLAQLKTSVDSWLLRDDIAVSGSDFPQILLIAESNIARDLRCVVQEVSADLVFTGRDQDLPSDYLQERVPFIDDNIRKFEYKTPEVIRESSNWSSGRIGQFYTLEGSEDISGLGDDRVKMVIAGPATPSTPLTVSVNYFRRFPALVNNTDTNWLLKNHFDVYLYAATQAACAVIEDFSKEDRYKAKYDEAVFNTNRSENRKRTGGRAKQSYGNPRGVV